MLAWLRQRFCHESWLWMSLLAALPQPLQLAAGFGATPTGRWRCTGTATLHVPASLPLLPGLFYGCNTTGYGKLCPHRGATRYLLFTVQPCLLLWYMYRPL